MRTSSAWLIGAKTSDKLQGSSTVMSHKGHENKWYGVPCQKMGISFCSTPSSTSFLLRCSQLKMAVCWAKNAWLQFPRWVTMGVYIAYFQWTWHHPIIQPTTHPPLPHSTNLCAYPQHMTMTGIYEFHTRNRFQSVKSDQVCEFLVLLPKINYMLYHSKWKTFIAQNVRQFVQTEQKLWHHCAQR